VGGDLNAYTNKEDTCYYAAVPKEHVWRAVDLLTDIVFHSTYPQAEINKEVEVICDEIESYNDSPAELIYDDFENIIFKGHPLGHNILGTADNVRRFTTADALRFTRRYYRPDNAVFFIYGEVDINKLKKSLGGPIGPTPTPTGPTPNPTGPTPGPTGPTPTPTGPTPTPSLKREGNEVTGDHADVPVSMVGLSPSLHREGLGVGPEGLGVGPVGPGVGQVGPIIIPKGTHQSHVMLGNRAYSATDSRRMALYLLNNILGGPGMNARLNLILREHHGLVYSVDSSMVNYGDTGLWCAYFGCDPHDVKRCLRLVRRELNRFMQAPLTPTRLQAAKKQLKGQINVGCDNRENFALSFGKSFLHYGWERDIDELCTRIDAITAEEILAVAQDIFNPDTMTTLIYQ
jgi:predicted Zn-dependent peptidase